jgi:WD40 repeat protein
MPAGTCARTCFSPDGKTLATFPANGYYRVQMWDVQSGKLVGEEDRGHQGVVEALALSPDGKTLYSGGTRAVVCSWDVPSGKLLKTSGLEGTSGIYLVFHPSRSVLAVPGSGSTIALVDVKTNKNLARLAVNCTCFASAGTGICLRES